MNADTKIKVYMWLENGENDIDDAVAYIDKLFAKKIIKMSFGHLDYKRRDYNRFAIFEISLDENFAFLRSQNQFDIYDLAWHLIKGGLGGAVPFYELIFFGGDYLRWFFKDTLIEIKDAPKIDFCEYAVYVGQPDGEKVLIANFQLTPQRNFILGMPYSVSNPKFFEFFADAPFVINARISLDAEMKFMERLERLCGIFNWPGVKFMRDTLMKRHMELMFKVLGELI